MRLLLHNIFSSIKYIMVSINQVHETGESQGLILDPSVHYLFKGKLKPLVYLQHNFHPMIIN